MSLEVGFAGMVLRDSLSKLRWWPGPLVLSQPKPLQQALKSGFRCSTSKSGSSLEGGHGGAPAFVAVLKQRQGFALFANLRIAPGCFNQGTTFLERFPALAHKTLKAGGLEGLSNDLCFLWSGNSLP